MAFELLIGARDFGLNVESHGRTIGLAAIASTGAPRDAAKTTPLIPGALTSRPYFLNAPVPWAIPCRDKIVVTGIGSSNCVYHAVIGFPIRNYYSIVPEDCIHGVHPQSQPFALHQFRTGAYNCFNVTVSQFDDLKLVSQSVPPAVVPQANQLNVEQFTGRSLIGALEREDFIAKVYDGR